MPKWKQSHDKGDLLTGSVRGRFDFTLRRLARFQLLLIKAASVCQRIAKSQLDKSASEYGLEIFYPRLAIEARIAKDEPIDELNRHYALNDPHNLVGRCANRTLFACNRHTTRRRDYQTLFPRRIWVPENQKAFSRFTIFHCCEYPNDNVERDQAENNRLRTLVYSDTLTDIVLIEPARQDKATSTDQPMTKDETTETDQPTIKEESTETDREDNNEFLRDDAVEMVNVENE